MKEQIMKLIEECNHWQPDYNFACIDKNKLKKLLDKSFKKTNESKTNLKLLEKIKLKSNEIFIAIALYLIVTLMVINIFRLTRGIA